MPTTTCWSAAPRTSRRAKREGKLAVSFDLEGSAMLEDDLAMVQLYRDLGVRQIHLAYNRDNSIAGGCHGSDAPLTALGREVVDEINRVGLIMDCSHSGYRTSLEIMERSRRPVVFSHSNVKALKNHARNVTDDQIDACAKTGGVVAISGIGIFLGADDISTETLHPPHRLCRGARRRRSCRARPRLCRRASQRRHPARLRSRRIGGRPATNTTSTI